jgi:hypothetical protein
MTVLTPPQLATRWKAKPETVRRLLETGQLRGFTISPPGTKKRHWRITLDAVLAYESGDSTSAQAQPKQRRRLVRAEAPVGPF